MRLVMMGTGGFAVPTFESLFDTHHEIVALITGPLRKCRSRSAVSTPMRDIATEHGALVYDPVNINSEESLDLLRSLRADLLVVCDFGQILSADALATARLGGVNLHCSLLPKYRGAAPINWTLLNGDTETGVSVIHMTPRVDAGPVIALSPPTPIEPDETAVELEKRLAMIGAWFVRRTIDSLEAGLLQALPQDPTLASKAPKLKKEDGLIWWDRSAQDVVNQYRGMQPWPKTYTFWHRRDGQPLRLIVGPVRLAEAYLADSLNDDEEVTPGTIVSIDEERLIVATGRGFVELIGIQPSGKRRLTAAEFLRGYPIQPGDLLGAEQASTIELEASIQKKTG